MTSLQKYIARKSFVGLAVIILGLAVALIFTGLNRSVNQTISNFFLSISGEKQPDSNIVIIHIDQNDIQKLGGWPLKRSYYALLIGKLTSLHVAKIGIEVLLSSNAAMQGIYNELLSEELKRSGRVVLSSIVSKEGDKFDKDSIIYSQPKAKNPELQSGHLNYISKNGIYIPAEIRVGNKKEKAFAIKLAGKNSSDPLIKVNFYTSWKKFKNYSLIEFFRMVEENNPQLANFKNKIVVVGISDPSIAKTIRTFYDDELPGVGLHAIVLDNILTNRSLNYKAASILTFIFLIVLLTLTQFKYRFPFYYIIGFAFAGYLILSFIFFSLFNVEINHTALVLPLFLLGVLEIFYMISEGKTKLSESYNESVVLRLALNKKEERLEKLQEEFKRCTETSQNELNKKINLLKEEILRLKKIQKEDEEVTPVISQTDVRNFHGIVYRSEKIENVVNTIQKIAPYDATVLILGESGSGKELAAHAIHNLSRRKEENFIAVNCAALTETLLESELFGHVKGAFTNAIADKKGRFELADNGTIFLDEIGETSENFQAKLLRVIQFGDFDKVGSAHTQHVNVRIIAATNKNLENLVREKKFREDLYYRLNVLKLELPPLRRRREDIEILANWFVGREDASIKISKAVMESLTANNWKGNVRELESVIKRAVIFAKSEKRNIIKVSDLPGEYQLYDKTNLEDFILDSLRAKDFSHSSINETAKELGNLSRTIVSENLRGIFFKTFVSNSFILEDAIKEIAAAENSEVEERIRNKAVTYLENIENDLHKAHGKNFDRIKSAFSSKYRNLPSKYHQYLDEVIKHLLEKVPEQISSGI
ncbi:MAG: sigma 54-interacting transcriptional regulator [Bacteroidota bacterium]